MRRFNLGRFVVAVCALGLVLPAVATAAPEVRPADARKDDELLFPQLDCGETHSRSILLPASAEGIAIDRPHVGQTVASDPVETDSYWTHVATVAAVSIATDAATERPAVVVTMVGAGDMCGTLAFIIDEDEGASEVRYTVRYHYEREPTAITRCSPIKWRAGEVRPKRNGWVRCSLVAALMRGWAKRADRSLKPLVRARVRGFRCIQRPDDITCVRGEGRATWRAPKPKPPKPTPKPIPGPLGWGEARRSALRIANNFPIYVDRRKITWCNRWSAWEVHCGVQGWAIDYDYVTDERFVGDICSDTAYVTKRPGEFARVRSGGDLSCLYE